VADLLEVCQVDVLRVRLAAMAELAGLRREHHLVAAAGQRPTNELLVKAGAVYLGGVDQGHAEVDGPADRPDRPLVILPRPVCYAGIPIAPKPMRATSKRPSLAH
jgi:hypothetical protein